VLSGPVPAVVVEVVDGDTLRVRARIWLDQDVTTSVRLAGVDAPEMHGACRREREIARRAQAFVASQLAPAGDHGASVRLRDLRYGKYARRVIARVETAAGLDLGAALLAAGLARPYDGGARAGWCG
jgi:micrococcal nuclease